MNYTLTVKRLLSDGQWLDNQTVHVQNGQIAKIEPAQCSDDKSTDYKPADEESSSYTMIPGYIDLQVNGGGGCLFNARPDTDSLKCMAQSHRTFGTTAMLPTLITDQYSVMQQSADAIAQAIDEGITGVIGVHFEGPFLNAQKKGVHPEAFIRSATDKELALFTRKDIGKVLVTIAPDNVPADIIRELVGKGVKVCLGHSNACYDQVLVALEAGADGFTHIFNAMSPLTSREPGMVGAALSHTDSYAGLILDHHHVHPTLSKLAIDVKGVAKTFLVSDAMHHVGHPKNELPYFDTVITQQNGRLTTPDGTLAGSCLDMHQAVLNAHNDLNIPLKDAIAMASATPARYLGMSRQLGDLRVGCNADFILLDPQLNIKHVYVAGKPLFHQEVLS